MKGSKPSISISKFVFCSMALLQFPSPSVLQGCLLSFFFSFFLFYINSSYLKFDILLVYLNIYNSFCLYQVSEDRLILENLDKKMAMSVHWFDAQQNMYPNVVSYFNYNLHQNMINSVYHLTTNLFRYHLYNTPGKNAR